MAEPEPSDLIGKNNMEWLNKAACKGMDLAMFYAAEDQKSTAYIKAKKICKRCKVKNECLALANFWEDPYGLWGGLSNTIREPMRTDARRLGVDWSNIVEAKMFLKIYKKFREEGTALGINWSDKKQVNKFRNSYPWVFQPTLRNNFKPIVNGVTPKPL